MILEEAQEIAAEEENYFISMSDLMVGLVFIFIILLMYFAIQFQDVTEELSGAGKTRTEILKKLEQTLRNKGVEVTIDKQDGVLRLPDSILFDSGQSELKPDGRLAVGHLAEALIDVLPCYSEGVDKQKSCPPTKHRVESVYIEGHTDSDHYSGGGKLKDNWDLSVVRATNTYRKLAELEPRLSILCARKGSQCDPILSVSGYGAQRPVPDNTGSEDARKKRNRRIDLRLIMVTPDSGATRNALSDRLSK
jgi:chemotaxis protein MotB